MSRERTDEGSRRSAALAALGALLLLGGGCVPTLGPYINQLDPDGAIHPKAVAEPERSAAPAIARHVAVCRFTDDRAWSDTFHVGSAIKDFLAYVFTLGFAAGYDALHQQHRDQPMGGLERELPRRIATFADGANTFTSCRFVDHSLEGLAHLKGERALPASIDLLLTGSIRAFTGEWEVAPSEGARWRAPITATRGWIEAVVSIRDARTRAELWSGTVAVSLPLDEVAWSLKDDTECTLRNKLAVAALGAFLKQVDATLREQFSAALPAR